MRSANKIFCLQHIPFLEFIRQVYYEVSLSHGVAAHVTLSDQNTLTSKLWEGEKGNF